MRNILQDVREKIKSIVADDRYFMALIVVLVAVTSFGLGRQSLPEAARQRAAVGAVAPTIATTSVADDAESLPSTYYVASRNGQVYHLPHCSGAKRITETNKIIFRSKAEAEAAGYRPAANCKGI